MSSSLRSFDANQVATTQHREDLSDRQLPHHVMPGVHHETLRPDIQRDAARSRTPACPDTPDNKRYDHNNSHTEATASPRHPSTPEVPPLQPLLIADISPTDSNFSTALGTIFDPPFPHGRHAPITPNTASYASTPSSSVCGQHGAYDRSSTWAQHSDTDTLCDSDAHLEDSDVPLLDPAAPHLISLTSCLQCVLADLPCSRTLPSCMRCVRNGEAVCVAQRNRVLQEMRRDGYNDDPILVVEVGEGEEVAKKKEEEMKELLAKWRAAHERSFWAPMTERLPWDAQHPGKGKGRVVLRTMRVAKWHPSAFVEEY